MPPQAIDYETPKSLSRLRPGFALGAVILHWALLFGWGILLNDSAGGYVYCRLTMPGPFDWFATGWIFTAVGVGVVFALGVLDRTRLNRSAWVAFLPTLLFLLTQIFSLWFNVTSVRY